MNKNIETLKNIDWDVQRFNAYPFFISSVATLSGFKLPWGLSYKHFLCISHNKNIEWHYDKSDYIEIGNIFWNRIKTLDDLMLLMNEYRSNYEKSVIDSQYEESGLDRLTISELIELLDRQVSRLMASGGIAHIVECASYVAEHTLLAKEGIDSSTIKASEKSFLSKAEQYAKELLNSEKEDEIVLKKFKDKYGWVQSSYLGRNDIFIDSIKTIANKFENNLNSSDLNIIDNKDTLLVILSHIFSWQDERKAHILESIYKAQPVLDTLADKLNIQREAIKFLLPEEIKKITEKDFQECLIERTKLFVDYAPKNLMRTHYTGIEAENFIREFTLVKTNEVDHVIGKTAFPGKVRGRARICLSLESIGKFSEGEILVASMTRPEYIPAMRKAIAFVTDEGGITCHAAIIAREMKKPCIIGTKNTTKILKDGDLIEVDAEKGVVTIIK